MVESPVARAETRSIVPSGKVRWAAVWPMGWNISPVEVRRLSRSPPPYQDARTICPPVARGAVGSPGAWLWARAAMSSENACRIPALPRPPWACAAPRNARLEEATRMNRPIFNDILQIEGSRRARLARERRRRGTSGDDETPRPRSTRKPRHRPGFAQALLDCREAAPKGAPVASAATPWGISQPGVRLTWRRHKGVDAFRPAKIARRFFA